MTADCIDDHIDDRIDSATVDALYRRWGGMVRGYCHRQLVNHQDAEDIAQLVWLKMLQFKGTIHHPYPWLFRAIRNAMIDLYRERSRQAAIMDIVGLDDAYDPGEEGYEGNPRIEHRSSCSTMPSAEDEAFTRMDLERAIQATRRLSPDQYQALTLSVQGYQAQEIGPAMGKPSSAGKALLHRARVNLRAAREAE